MTGVLLAVAWFARQNHFEWKFRPVPDPQFVAAREAKGVTPDELVIGVARNQEALAFPVRRIGQRVRHQRPRRLRSARRAHADARADVLRLLVRLAPLSPGRGAVPRVDAARGIARVPLIPHAARLPHHGAIRGATFTGWLRLISVPVVVT